MNSQAFSAFVMWLCSIALVGAGIGMVGFEWGLYLTVPMFVLIFLGAVGAVISIPALWVHEWVKE